MDRVYRRFALALILLPAPLFADPSLIEGRWLTQERDGWVRITRLADGLEGRIAGSPPGSPNRRKLDELNPDPALRHRELDGLKILTGFEYDGSGRWENGTIYDPNTGKTYNCTVTLLDADTLRIRGYVGVSLFGRSETWTRDEPDPDTD